MIYEEKVLGEPRSNQCATRRGTKGPKVEEEEKKKKKISSFRLLPHIQLTGPCSNICRALSFVFFSSTVTQVWRRRRAPRCCARHWPGTITAWRCLFFCVPPSRNPIRPFESLYFHWFKKKPRTSSSQLSPPGFSLLLSPLFFFS